MCPDASVGCPGHDGAMAGDTELSAPVVDAARGQIRQRGMGKTVQRLTVVLLVLLTGQGRHGRHRNLAAAMHGRARRRRVDGEATGRPAMLAVRGRLWLGQRR